ncbi:MAG TPA: hypothetical protein ENF42_01670 [Candidatus Bathyarchaeota archaeon]|nr:hypothetical protein [Candidatus Bathyarchaeota archaeon]
MKCRYKYVGLIGMPGSGKDKCAAYISNKYKMVIIRLSDVVEREAYKMGYKKITREALRQVGTEIRKRLGQEAVMRLAAEEGERLMVSGEYSGVVFNGLRTIEEVLFFKEKYGIEGCIIGVFATLKTRYNRVKERGRYGFDVKDYQSFLDEDMRELKLFGIGNAMMLADYIIVNEGSLEELHVNLQVLLENR